MAWEALAAAIESAGTYSTIAEAVESGIIIIKDTSAVGGLVTIEGGAGTAVVSSSASALEVAQAASLAGKAAKASTGAVTLVKTGSGFKLGGLATMSLPAVAAAAAPLAGVNLGANLYLDNPSLWAKISSTLLPFCYAEDKIQAFVDFVKDPLTSEYSPIVTIPTAIIDALKSLFDDEVDFDGEMAFDSAYGTLTGLAFPDEYPYPAHPEYPFKKTSSEPAYGLIVLDNGIYYSYSNADVRYKSNYYGGTYNGKNAGWATMPTHQSNWSGWAAYLPIVSMSINLAKSIIANATTSVIPATAGVSAPTITVEPIVWPDTPIIVVPDPLGPDYQPIPVTPIVPMLPPYEPPLPLPEYAPDPTPEVPPEGWPEGEPWPTVVPAPWTEPDTEPTPETPYIPWPLPETRPDEDDPQPDYWPTYPPAWPEEYPTELPWPESPQEWPSTVPWPELEPGTEPEWWPDGEPWPDSPQEWPDDVPWPMPPEWPFPWPDDIPYPWPFPYPLPDPSPDPYPDPEDIPDPDQRVDPIIDPWPWPIPDPKTDPDSNPKDDPSQPEPQPEPEPDIQPVNPDPPPPSGTIEPAPPPIIPLPFSSTTGLISVYHPTQSELLAFCNWLWVTWQDTTIEKIWNNPFDGVITLFELYCTPTDVGRKTIRSGFLDSNVSSETISRYTEIDCGSIGVPEYFGNYLDYAPYSKCNIYLPFIGIIELNVDDIVGHGVNVTYRIDEYNGSCIAMITVAKSTSVNGTDVEYSNIMYQFSGNCAVDLPIAGGSQAAIKAGMLEAAAWGIGSVVGGIMSGSSPLSIGAGMAYGAAGAVHSLVSAKSSVQHSGSFGASFGALGNKKPFIIVTRPKQIQVPNYQELYGYPAHKMVIIGDCTGYLRCREVHVISPTASDEEKTLIEQMLKEGVYITE